MTECDEDETLLPSVTVDLTEVSTEVVAASSSEDSEDDFFASLITHQRASMLCQGRRTEGFKGRGQSEDVVKKRRMRDEDGDFQHRDSSTRRSGRRRGLSWVG